MYTKIQTLKALINILLLLFSCGLLAQTDQWKKCGLDDGASLNQYEAEYFNEVFQDRRGDFNFTGKKIAYFTGSLGKSNSNKSTYFNNLKYANNGKDKTIHEWQSGGTQFIILTHEEKEKSGGFDAILVSWSKLLIHGKSRARLIKKLKKNNPKKN